MIPTWVKLLGIVALVEFLFRTLNNKENKNMYNSHDEIQSYHNEEVTLPQSERDEMRKRRDTNRKQLKDGLEHDDEPKPIDFQSQGSYAHRTMVQHKDKDYDIDDGVYFSKDDLKGKKGGNKSAGDAKEMVRKALHRDQFNKPPEVRTNCVRVYYDAGYHADVPVYREVKGINDLGEEETYYEIASTDWKESDPVAVNHWFQEKNKHLSPDEENGRQLRRLARLLKAFARSRENWRDRIASGFTITTLIVEECYCPDPIRDDKALYDTMVAIRDRLKSNLEVEHPIIEGEMLTSGPDDAKTKFLWKKLDKAIKDLDILFDSNCNREQMLEAWDKVFHTDFFSKLLNDDDTTGQKGISASGVTPSSPVNKIGGGRFA